MRVPRHHRSVAIVPVAGTCLAGGLTAMAAVDEAVAAGVRIPFERRPLVIHHVVSGRQRYVLNDREIPCLPGSLVVLAGGQRSAEEVDGRTPFHTVYATLEGAWASRLDVDLATVGGVLVDAHPPTAVVQALHELVRVALARPAGWDWTAMALVARICAHCSSLCGQGGATFAERLGRLIDEDPADAWRLPRAAATLAVTVPVLNHRFRAETGEAPAAWIRRRRMDHARRLLALGQRPTAVAEALGFGSLSQFSRAFKATVGCWPIEYRQRA